MTKQKWLMVVGALIAFAAGAYIVTSGDGEKLTSDEKPERKARPVDMEKLPVDWREVDSEDDLEEFYIERIPDLPLARKKGVTTSPEEMMTVEGKEGRIQINEVWHRGQRMTFLYSIDLSLLIDQEDNTYIQPPRIDTVDIEQSGDIPAQVLHGYSELDKSNAVIFENRLYGVLQTQPLSKDVEKDQGPVPPAEPVDAIAKTSLKVNLSAEILNTDSIAVPYQYNPKAQQIASREFSGSYSKDDLTIEPQDFVMSLSSNYITIKLESENKQFNRTLEGRIVIDDRKLPFSPYLQPVEGEKDVYKAYFGSLPEVPDDVSLRIRSIDMKEKQSLSFTLDIPDLEDKDHYEKHLDRKVAEANNTDIYLEQLNYHKNYGMDFSLKYRPQQPEQMSTVVGTLDTFNPEHNQEDITVQTDNGHSGYANTAGSRLRSNVNIDHDLLEGATRATVTFHSLAVSHKINHTFEIEEN